MRRVWRAVLLLLLASVPSAAQVKNDEQAILQVMQRCYGTLSAREFLAFRDCFWPQALITTCWKISPKAKNPQLYAQYIEEFIVNTEKSMGQFASFSDSSLAHEIQIYDNIAQVWSIYEVRFQNLEGKTASWRGIDMFQFIRDQDQWRIIALTFTREIPAQPLLRSGASK